MKLLVTGGAGYIGYSLIDHLMKHNMCVSEVVVYDNLMRQHYAFFHHAKFQHKPIRYVQGELLDSRKLQQAMKGVDIVIHLAAKVTTPYADAEAHFFEQNNHWGTAALIDAVEESNVQHFIHMSSMSVYGSSTEPVDETHEPRPESFYGISKLRAEEHVARLEGRIRTHVLRAANVYGYNPCVRMDAVVNRFMFEANFYGRVTVNGAGEQRRTFIGIEKLASVVDSLICLNVPSGVYNIAEHNLSVREVADAVQQLYPELEMLYIAKNMPMRQIVAHTPCKILDYISLPKTSLAEELQTFKAQFAF
jgi:UDP-glucose 4-epimerase